MTVTDMVCFLSAVGMGCFRLLPALACCHHCIAVIAFAATRRHDDHITHTSRVFGMFSGMITAWKRHEHGMRAVDSMVAS